MLALIASFLLLINQSRTDAGLDPLVQCGNLQSFADARASQQVSWNTLSHYIDGKLAITSQLNRYWIVGENLGGEPDMIRPGIIHAAMMDSPTHRANILEKRYRCVDIGISGTVIAQEFGG